MYPTSRSLPVIFRKNTSPKEIEDVWQHAGQSISRYRLSWSVRLPLSGTEGRITTTEHDSLPQRTQGAISFTWPLCGHLVTRCPGYSDVLGRPTQLRPARPPHSALNVISARGVRKDEQKSAG